MEETEELRCRVLICNTCKSAERLAWFAGLPEYDEELLARLEPHKTDGTPHRGSLMTISKKRWDDPAFRAQISH
jgi:hypothetical protein